MVGHRPKSPQHLALKCSSCDVVRPRDWFSKKQWDKGRSKRCKLCVTPSKVSAQQSPSCIRETPASPATLATALSTTATPLDKEGAPSTHKQRGTKRSLDHALECSNNGYTPSKDHPSKKQRATTHVEAHHAMEDMIVARAQSPSHGHGQQRPRRRGKSNHTSPSSPRPSSAN